MTIVVDGRTIEAHEGELLLDALRRAGHAVPTLCHDDALEPYGGCRLCLVDVDGSTRPVPACATRVGEGMVVSTNGRVSGLRTTLTEMLLSEHREAAGGRADELAALADGIAPPLALEPHAPYEDRNRLLGYDPEACILCARCVRYTREVMGCGALGIEGRGADARVVPTHGFSWLDTDCELCGGCLAVCPTGAIYEKAAVGAPEAGLTKVRTTCPYCGVGCQLDLNVDPETRRIVKVTSRRGYLPNDGELCVKGRFGTGFVHHPDRLTRPLVRGADGELHPASWDDAIRTAADGLLAVKRRHGAHALGVVASARLTMEENYLTQKLARTRFEVNSVQSCEAT
jgi:predicted molibdopterin-dependent oxidoreductase YjgC